MTPVNEPLQRGNIELTYRISVLFGPGMDTVLHANGATVFIDEHGVQWIKFYPKNGPVAGKQHIMRTDQVVIVNEEG